MREYDKKQIEICKKYLEQKLIDFREYLINKCDYDDSLELTIETKKNE